MDFERVVRDDEGNIDELIEYLRFLQRILLMIRI